METPVMGTSEVTIAKPSGPYKPEELPFWDSPKEGEGIYNHLTYDLVKSAALQAFKGHNNKYDVRNFKKHLDKNLHELYNSLLDGTYTRFIRYKKLQKVNHRGKLRLIDSPILPLRILQWLWLLIVVPLYNKKDNGNGRNCKPKHGITAEQSKYGILKPQKHLFYDLRHLHYVLVMDQRKAYEHITPKLYRKQIKRILTDRKFIKFGEDIGFINGKLPIGTPTSPYIHHICLLTSDWFIRDNTEWSVRYADNNVMAFRTSEEAQAFKWRLMNFWWYELHLRPKRQMTVIINIDKNPLDNCGYVTHRNPLKKVPCHDKGYTFLRAATLRRVKQCRNPKSWTSYFGLLLHADAFKLMTKLENNMPELGELTKKIRIDREIDAPSINIRDLLGVKFTLYKYRFKDYKGKTNWVQCLIGTKKWINSTANSSRKNPKKVPRGSRQEYAWEFHGNYQGLILYLKKLEEVMKKEEFLPITKAEIVQDGEFIFKDSTNKQQFIN